MIVKKYTGFTAHEAMSQLKKELGSNAIVLNTRTIRQKGFFGFFKKPIIEVTAAYEAEDALLSKPYNSEGIDKINNEILTLKSMIAEVSDNIEGGKIKFSPKLKGYFGELVKNGVDYLIATSILKQMSEKINFEDEDEATIDNIVKSTLSQYIGQAQPIDIEDGVQKVFFFIGPTGVGKTTTLAKIVARLVMDTKYKIGLVTSDTYRIAAVDQLKTYSDILQLPLEIVYDSKDFYQTLVKFREKDLIFVDTVGKNHREVTQEDELYKIMNSIKNKEVYLVLSGTTNFNVLKSIIDYYDFLEDYKIIFTKIDEAREFGNILNIKYLIRNPISYITTGQSVPDDIEVLDKDKVASCLIGRGCK